MQDKPNQEETNIKLEIGEYVYYFQSMCRSMESLILTILRWCGLNNDDIGRILIGNLGADKLRTVSIHMFKSFVILKDAENQIIDKGFSLIQKIIEERNKIVHSTWYIHKDGYCEVGSSYKISGKGKELVSQYTKNKLDEEDEKCILARNLLNILQAVILFDKADLISESFEIFEGELKTKKENMHSD
ncbi:hypothetical protein JKG47_10370 [Acidithiobacillus sp. MC6.1]|nr:hypothetical protein [Acidithiobacillus sp. MC6.1]